MRTEDEIVARANQIKGEDFFGVQLSDLLTYVSFEKARPFLREDCTKEVWDEGRKPYTEENVKAEMLDYMPFAWGKANDMRGLSASRSIDHYRAWTWLLGDELYNKLEAIEYQHYGKEKLIAICEHFGWDWKQWDDGIRTNG